jgi:cytochrome P450
MTVFTPNDDSYADLSDHDSFINGAPYNTFCRLRKEDPVSWCDGGNHKGFWSITRHEDIMLLNRDFRRVSSAQGIRLEDQTYEEYLARRTFQETDPPEHSRTRMLVAKAFSRPVVAQFEADIQQLCDQILDEALQSSEVDAVKKIARQLPMRMLGRIIGVPDQDLDWLVEKGDALIANTDPDFSKHVLDKDDTDAYRLMPFRSPAGVELWNYATKLMESKVRSRDKLGVLSLITQPNSRGEVISDAEFRNFFCLLVAAGNDTTRYTIAGAIHAIANQQGLLQELQQATDETWKNLPDEFVRWASPAMHFRRTAIQDVTLRNQKIKEGDKVVLWFVSANRDSDVFEHPYRVGIARTPNPHLGFGQGGPHVCLGMWLARLEVRILLKSLVSRVSAITQSGDHTFLRSNFVGGIKQLPIRITL